MTKKLLSEIKINKIITFQNRVVMSAMTRGFADNNHCATKDILNYYERRAKSDVGLIITEGIIIHPSADGYNNVPHLFTREQMLSWKEVVKAIHKYKTKIYAQLWHCGRISHNDYTGGLEPVSSTSNQATGINRQNQKPFGKPRALKLNEMKNIYDMFNHSAELALEAGFDGVQIHMGHGYLVDQFLDANINDRQDIYGGTIENRIRFAIELLDSLIKNIGNEKIMVRISPSRFMGGLYEWPDMTNVLKKLLKEFDFYGLRQLDISCANSNYFETSGKVIKLIKKQWPHLLIGGASLTITEAENEITEGNLDMITWGRAILANPDFVKLVKKGFPLKAFDNTMRESLI
jgi:N-ethylmaleimide reductase